MKFQLLIKLKYQQMKKFLALSFSDVVFIMLINVKGPLTVVTNGNHSVSLPIILIEIEVDQMLPSSYISLLLVPILWYCISFPISMNVRLYFGAKMVTFCIIHIHSVGPEVYGICACTFFWDCTSTDKLFVQGGLLETVSRFVVFVNFDYFSVK